ncbi:MAG: GWxTD domain-containing protein [Bacteroidota bacterium]
MRICYFLTLIFLTACSALSQQERFPRNAPDFQERPGVTPIHVDLINLASLDSLKSRLLIIFDIPQSFFIFMKNPGQNAAYSAKGEISIEILDTSKNSITRHIVHKELNRLSPLVENDIHQQSINHTVCFDLDPGTYDCIVEVSDLESTREFNHTFRKILKDFRKPYTTSDIIILSPDSTDEKVLHPLLRGGDAFLGENFRLYFETHSDYDTLRNITIKFFKYEHHPAESNLSFHDSIPLLILHRSQIGPLSNDSLTAFPLIPSQDGNRSAIINVKGDQIEYGQYMIEVKILHGEKKITISKLMTIRWPSMPRSLMRIDYAIDMLIYELSKSEFDSLKALDRNEQIRAFEKYWKSKDPTPGTAYNEALEEYYSRVDYAQSAYASIKSPDGAKTDRGKISILFGIPSSPERLFPTNGAPIEIWTYPELHKRFIFIDESRNGGYTLIRVEQI